MTALNELNGGGVSEDTNAGAPPVVSASPLEFRNVPGVKMLPSASSTPGVARTRASISAVTGEVCDLVWLPSACVGVITTSWPLLAAWKIDANDWLIVSVRM